MSGPLLITRGTLGNALAREARARGWGCLLAEAAWVVRALEQHRPSAVIDGTDSFVHPERKGPEGREVEGRRSSREARSDRALRPPHSVHALAAECALRKVPLVIFSSDEVFDGASGRPYFESDPPHPLTEHGAQQAHLESAVLGAHPEALVLRTGPRLCPWEPDGFVAQTLAALSRQLIARVPCEGVMSPSYVPHLATATLDLLRAGERGIWHLANRGAITWEALARETARLAGLPQHGIVTVSDGELGVTPGPRHSVLVSERGARLPLLHDALVEYVAAWREAGPRIAA